MSGLHFNNEAFAWLEDLTPHHEVSTRGGRRPRPANSQDTVRIQRG